MKDKTRKVLERFYNELKKKVRKEGKLKYDKVLFSLIHTNSNPRKDCLFEAGLNSVKFNYDDISYLDNQGYLQNIKGEISNDKYVLTAKGIWHMDKYVHSLNEEDLIDFIQKKDFEFEPETNSLSDKEKLVLVSMIGIRCFSKDSLLDLRNDRYEKYWIEIFEESYNFLTGKKIISENKDLFKDRTRSSSVEWIMSRVNDLPKNTSYIFKFNGDKTYYLNLKSNRDNISFEKLAYLFKCIFEKTDFDITLLRSTHEFCENLAYNKARFVKNNGTYRNSKIDSLIYDALKKNLQ